MPPNKQLDTGTGGFPLDDGKLHTYDVGVDDSTSVSLASQAWSPGSISVDDTEHDLPKPTRQTLSSYLSKTTMAKTGPSKLPNSYPIDGASNDQQSVSLTDEKGYPSPVVPSQNTSQFAKGVPSGRSQIATTDNLPLQRGKQSPVGKNSVDGNSLLPTAQDDQGPVAKYTDTILNNRFAAQTNAGNDYRFSSDAKYEDYFVSNRSDGRPQDEQLGKPQFPAKYVSGKSAAASPRVSFGQLAQVGPLLTLRAGIEMKSNSSGVNPNDLEASSILPGTEQLGIERPDVTSLTASDILSDLTSDAINGGQLIDISSKSWGSLNNVLDQYSGISAFGMKLLSIALVVALGVIFSLFFALFLIPSRPKLGNASSLELPYDEAGRRYYGSYLGRTGAAASFTVSGIMKSILSGSFDFWQLIGVAPTVNDRSKCLVRGALLFFGIDGTDWKDALSDALAGAENPGFNVIMARNVSRSFLLISDSLKGITKAFASGITAGIKALLEFVDVLRQSKFIGAINVFCLIGDKVLTGVSDSLREDPSTRGAAGKRISIIDNIPNSPLSNQQKNRLAGASAPRTAWSTYRASDNLITSKTLYTLAIRPGSLQGANPATIEQLNVKDANGKNTLDWGINNPFIETETGRISTDQREKFEAQLDAEYVPFYFHDVRTNEIVSFHAFLSKLSDSYTPSYDSQEAFGRVESIKVYKGTSRKLDFGFTIAALSPNDLHTMWNKINKLTTLVYPQFTAGKYVTSSDGKYTMTLPFSQTIGASPMIRLRIGDLIQSNYSKFDLARLFGYGIPGTKFGDGAELAQVASGNGDVQVDISKELLRLKTSVSEAEFSYSGKLIAVSGGPELQLPDSYVLKYKESSTEADRATYVVSEMNKKSKSFNEQKLAAANQEFGNADAPDKNVLGKSYSLKIADVIPTDDTKDMAVKVVNAQNENYANGMKSFMDDSSNGTGNAVAKSFRTAGGRGLAGFIESMSFEWLDKATWAGLGEPQPAGQRVPKMCEVSISFTPVHDITPGLDVYGTNRAAVYPVLGYNNVASAKATK